VIVSETRERFIGAIAGRLPTAEVVEAHFFGPRRRGEVESGVAVVAARVPQDGVEQAPDRYTVFSATYLLTLKGVDRGKWEASVTPEADAPLIAVDEVVRGVVRRTEETDEVTRMSGAEFRAIAESRLFPAR
jgi:hypothetical protein